MKTKNNHKFIFKNKYTMPNGRQGFTLLELMVIISIIGIMTSAGLVSLSSSKKHFALKTAQNEVAAAIKLAQSYALQGKYPTTGVKICGIGFRFETTSKYLIFYYDDGVGGNCSTATVIGRGRFEEQTLKNGVTLSSPNNPNSNTMILFSIPDAKVSGAGVGSTFTLAVGGKSKDFTISSTGLVEEN